MNDVELKYLAKLHQWVVVLDTYDINIHVVYK